MKKFSILLFVLLIVTSCGNDNQGDDESSSSNTAASKPKIIHEFGYTLNNYKVIKDTIKKGESFGIILDRHHVYYPKINAIAKKIKDTFDVRRIRAGIPYMILASKDTLEKAEVFIYKNSKASATIVDFKDSTIIAYKYRKPIKIIEKEVAGKIYSTLSEAMDSLHLNPNLTYNVADIYAWTLDFGKLQRGDRFKLIYEEKFIDDSVFVGYGKVKAALFDHNNRDFYAYRFIPDSIKGIPEYYDEKGNMLRSQFLRSPIKFQYRVSSRYQFKKKNSILWESKASQRNRFCCQSWNSNYGNC